MNFSTGAISLLEVSHLPHMLAAADSFKKGYTAYAIVLTTTIVFSILNHIPRLDNNILEYTEKGATYVTLVYTIIQFKEYIDAIDVVIAISAILLYLLALQDYNLHKTIYVPTHTLWHLVSGFLIYSIVLKAKNKREV